ncbi:antibiotic ABC transporter [Paracoccus aerodenitrificans]|uniref:antibiotic ABC transporter n=1 Tax=Paracoccus aerodenitrificans TaxID=3017781 RepID=UPI0022F1311F|nr:antibiotic ABC transporter [Paracoccus aerodenitrificans]WBU63366.1 antibiotic ABC transporter [Paracoccus aerodenitrificans]
MGFLPQGIAEATRLWVQVTQIAIESQMVIGMRIAGLMGFMPQSSNEPQRMVQEKLDAAQESGTAIMKAVTRGASYDQMMTAALNPYSRRTKANARRLTKAASRGRG